jgi:hypothetical protein
MQQDKGARPLKSLKRPFKGLLKAFKRLCKGFLKAFQKASRGL